MRRQITQLQTDQASLAQNFAQAKRAAHLSAPPAQFVVPSVAAPAKPVLDNSLTTNLIARLLKDRKAPLLTPGQVQTYLKANGTNAANLLAAFRASGDPALLQEAMTRYSDNPQVDLAAVFKPDASPEEQRQWLNAFEQSAPDNALANYLSALNYFQSRQPDQAVQELNAASTKSQFQDYTMADMLNIQDAYLAAGYSEADAGIIAGAQIGLPQLTALRQLGQDTVSLAGSYQQTGDPAAAQAALQMAVNIGENLDASDAPFIISQLAGNGIERGALGSVDPNTPYGTPGQTVQDQLNQLLQQRTALMNVNDQFNDMIQNMSDQEWVDFEERRAVLGNAAAEQWMISKPGQP